ncbi:MAG: GntR family transcriptional regulator [Actinomycetota bacterium]|nr:GntR family transcriptional regulator [Actinomycetota bacterium]
MAAGDGQSAQARAVSWLRAAIVTGDLRPGQQVIQDRVGAETGLSVATVREALRVLEREGQLNFIPRRGYFVTRLAVSDLDEIYGLRAILEPLAIRGALAQLDADGLARLEAAASQCASAAAAGDVSTELSANRRFHFGFMEAPGQEHLMRLITMLWDATEAYRALYYNFPDERKAAVAAHEQMLSAIRERDVAKLITLQEEHRDRALNLLRGLLAASDRIGVEA